MAELLKPGDLCPCCGMPILTHDPDKLLLLSQLAQALDKSGEERPGDRAEGKP